MHSMYSSKKGDSLCPLGFHPQVRWPTRCKRCFRDYKEHGGRRNSLGDITSSFPSLSSDSSNTRDSESKRTWSSATNLAKDETKNNSSQSATTTGWTSLMDLSAIDKDSEDTSRSENVKKPAKLQIKKVINKTNGGTSENDVEFIIQVRKSRPAPPKQVVEDGLDNVTVKEKETEKNEVEKLKSQLNDMKVRCEKAEKEKSEILLRRLTTMETMSNKTSTSEVTKLQKKNEALLQEKNMLMTKIRSLEKNSGVKSYRSERDKTQDDLRSKLKAAESLCETLMDENEDMKKEIRQLEEEIYEMQDNFRDEQADEYTRLRKTLEQSNKNCRILSFKLRKVERKAEELENEKSTLEKKYEEVKKTEEILQKMSGAFQDRTQKKATEFTTKIQLKKMVDEMEKEIENMLSVFNNIKNGHNLDIPNIKPKDNNVKYDKLLKEHELLKQNLESAVKELADEKEKKKVQKSVKVEDNKNVDLQNVKRKLDETVALREAERKSWEKEKTTLFEEKDKLKSKLLSLSAEKLKIYNEFVQLKKDLETAKSSEKDTTKIETTLNELKQKLTHEQEKCKRLQDDLSSNTERESKLAQSMKSMEQAKAKLDAEVKHLKKELDNTKSTTSTKITDLTAELTKLKRESEKLTSQLDNEKQSKEKEIASLQKKITSLERNGQNMKRMNELKQTYTEKISNLETDIKKHQQEQEALTEKYQELANQKLQLEKENESLNSKYSENIKDLNSTQMQLETVRNSMQMKEDEWRLEKSTLENQLRENQAPNKVIVIELNNEINVLKKENGTLLERLEDVKKINDDLSAKLKDYQAVSKIHQVLTPDTTALESEIRKLKNALTNMEKAKKADLAQCKMRYEHRVTAINDEIQAIRNQLSRYKRERDTYKHMLEGAQKTIGELKSSNRQGKLSNASSGKSDEDEETLKANVLVLEKQISCMDDELAEVRLEASRLKAELVSEKSASHVKVSELQSRINELEEERLLTSGRSKIPGLKVRMELAWQKEREEHQRLLQETATLARDLRQTLLEIERERSKEQLENKRRQDQLKKVFDEETEENKKKLSELQCDLLELRDAHAKLRTSNEKMRREKERHEKERQELKDVISNKCKLEQIELRNINILMQQVQDLLQLFPELNTVVENGTSGQYTPTPPRRLKGPKSRESSPMLETKGEVKTVTPILGERTHKLEFTIKKLMDVAKELKESKKTADAANTTRLKKLGKRATSVESDPGKGVVLDHSKARLKRKSLSLEQTAGRQQSPAIWGTDSNLSSMQSLEGSEIDSCGINLKRDSSVDSRLSGGSTRSEMLDRDKKYNKGIIRKFTNKLTKSSSVDDPNTTDYSLQTSGSETSINERSKMEKKNLKKKLSAMFKRGSRSSSVDKKAESRNSSRPASRNSMMSD